MTNVLDKFNNQRYRISRKGRKLNAIDDQRILMALPKEVPERTWAEILQKEENDFIIFEIREDIMEEACNIVYENYMQRQNAAFTVHCAAQAWLKLIDWCFYRHDPGEDPAAYPPCFIPKRLESWISDDMPDPSPKDTWGKQDLNVIEDTPDEGLQKWPSSTSIDMPIVEEIPSEYWFPGKVNIPVEESEEIFERTISYGASESRASSSDEQIGTESEVLQKITDYSTEEITAKVSAEKQPHPTPTEGSLHGAGDSTIDRLRTKRKSKSISRHVISKSRGYLPPLDNSSDSRSRITIISDCRLRSLRLDTQYEVSLEKVESPTNEIAPKRK